MIPGMVNPPLLFGYSNPLAVALGTQWNTAEKTAGIVLSGGAGAMWGVNVGDPGVYNNVFTVNKGLVSARYYWEVALTVASPDNLLLGIRKGADTLGQADWASGTYCYLFVDGTLHASAGITTTATGVTAFSDGDTAMFAFNAITHKLWVGKNGTWVNSGNPALGTNAQFSVIPTNSYAVHLTTNAAMVAAGSQSLANFGGTLASTPFSYAVPAGYYGGVPT